MDADQPPELSPHFSRMYDSMNRGRDNLPADRKLVEELMKASPHFPAGPRENQHYLRRAVRWLTAEAGVAQFLVLGVTRPNEADPRRVAHAVNPATRVVYVDCDPDILVHARALLDVSDKVRIVDADPRRLPHVLAEATVRTFLDWRQPIGVVMANIWHFIGPEHDPAGIMRQLRQALAPGGYVVFSQGTADGFPKEMADAVREVYASVEMPLTLRSRAEVEELLARWELVEPGLVWAPQWRPDGIGEDIADADTGIYVAVARVPG